MDRPGRIHAHDPWTKPLARHCRASGLVLGWGAVFFACPDWIRFVVTGWLQVGNTGFQQSLADVLHIRLLGIVQGGDK
jgi:hypothetical protein